jgi:hypothetical protein
MICTNSWVDYLPLLPPLLGLVFVVWWWIEDRQKPTFLEVDYMSRYKVDAKTARRMLRGG